MIYGQAERISLTTTASKVLDANQRKRKIWLTSTATTVLLSNEQDVPLDRCFRITSTFMTPPLETNGELWARTSSGTAILYVWVEYVN